jgi:uncharacterized protein (UPF0548 family)
MGTVAAPDAGLRAAWLRNVLFGLVAWAVGLAALRPEWAAALVLLGALVVVPLGLALVDTVDERSLGGRGAWLPWLQLAAALPLLGAFALDAGPPAGLLALPWCGFTALVAILGLRHLLARGVGSPAEVCLHSGLVFLAVGGAWTLLSRWGARPLGFEEPIVLLTGAHFHYAGFALPLLTGLAAGALRHSLSRVAVVGVVAGVPLVAVGITSASAAPMVDWLAASLLSGACVLVALMQLQTAARAGSRAGRWLLVLSGLSLAAGMVLAAVYALGNYRQAGWPTIPDMVRWHATLNALGFALPGLVAWNLERQRTRAEMQVLVTLLGMRPGLEEWEKRPPWPGLEAGPGAGDRRDAYEQEVGVEAPGAPEPDGCHRRAAQAVLAYRIFPPRPVRPLLRREPVEVGDTVGIGYHLLPGIDLFFAARVVARFDEPAGDTWRTGFTYRTLCGHPEYGEETFSVEKDMTTGRVRVVLRSWSRPGTLLARLFPLWVRRVQRRVSRAALENLAGVAGPRAADVDRGGRLFKDESGGSTFEPEEGENDGKR